MSVKAVGGFSGVEGAIRKAADATGVDFGYLLKTARRESGLNPGARASTSSAAGLFQFVEQTWLATVKRYGARHGLGGWADRITQGADGRFRVADPASRRALLDLRLDPQAAALMAGEMAADHAAYLKGRTGRDPSAGELYAAHFLGPAGSARLIEAARSRPDASAASLFPDAAAANPSIFRRDGRAVTAAELYADLTRTGGAGAATAGVPAPSADAPADGGALRSLAMAARLDRLAREQDLLGYLKGETGPGAGLFEAQLLGAFGPGEDAT
jgi:hypothetical protein